MKDKDRTRPGCWNTGGMNIGPVPRRTLKAVLKAVRVDTLFWRGEVGERRFLLN